MGHMLQTTSARFTPAKQAAENAQKPRAVDTVRPSANKHSFFGLRAFSIVSLLAVVVAAVLMAMGFRYVSILDIEHQSESVNIIAIEAELGEFVKPYLPLLVIAGETNGTLELPDEAVGKLRNLEARSALRQFSLIDTTGRTVYSMHAEDRVHQFGADQHFISAKKGLTVTKLSYRDYLNDYFATSNEKNLAQTYYPLRTTTSGVVVGVLLVATDVTTLVERSSLAQLLFISTALIIMLGLYFSLVTIVRRIENIINQQQIELSQRSSLLAVLSRRMIDTHETEKKQVAAELHERIAQTLASAKMEIEGAIATYRRGSDPEETLNKLVPILHAATQDVRQVATQIHPGSLEDFGLVTTLHMCLVEFRRQHAHIEVEEYFYLTNEDIPSSLTNIVYRVFADALSALAAEEALGRFSVWLEKINGALTLTIRDDSLTVDDRNKPYQSIYDKMQLSGGKFSLAANSDGGAILSVAWFA